MILYASRSIKAVFILHFSSKLIFSSPTRNIPFSISCCSSFVFISSFGFIDSIDCIDESKLMVDIQVITGAVGASVFLPINSLIKAL